MPEKEAPGELDPIPALEALPTIIIPKKIVSDNKLKQIFAYIITFK